MLNTRYTLDGQYVVLKQMVNVLYLYNALLVTVDHSKRVYTTGFCIHTHIHTLMAQYQEQLKVQGLTQGHFDMLTAGSAIEPGTFQ